MSDQSESEIGEVLPEDFAPAPEKPNWLLRGFVVLALCWIVLQVRWFWLSNPVLWSSEASGARFGVFGFLDGPWSFSLEHTDPVNLVQALTVLAMVQALGLLSLRILRIYLPFAERQAAAFAFGFGVSGIAFELLTMARLLHPVPAWVLWVLLLGSAGSLSWKRSRRPYREHWRRLPVLTYEVSPPSEKVIAASIRPDDSEQDPAAARVVRILAMPLLAVIVLLSLWHAVFYPETYWDSLILYLGYGRMTFLEGGFPFKAEAQVGIGLGANYPHLFSTFGAMASALFNEWSDLHQRIAAPVAALAATIGVYGAVRVVFRSCAAGVVAALLFRLTPQVIFFSTYASDYAFAMLYAAMLALFVAYFARTKSRGALVALFLIPAMAMHLNYLMVTLWGPAVVGALVALRRTQPVDPDAELDPNGVPEIPEHGPPVAQDPPSPLGLLTSRFAWIALVCCFLAGSTWFARNYVLTGNPVYAFFPEIFTGSVRVNKDVLRSAELEWYRNGDGIGRLAEVHRAWSQGIAEIDESSPAFRREAGFGDRIAASWHFWQGFDTARPPKAEGEQPRFGLWRDRLAVLLHGPNAALDDATVIPFPHAYKMSPLFLGFLIPGLLVALRILFSRRARPEAQALLAAMLVLGVGMLAYMYLIADFYLYQIIPVLVPMAIIAACLPLAFIQDRRLTTPAWLAFGALLLVSALVPGVAMSLMGFKFTGMRFVEGRLYMQPQLDALRNPGMPAHRFYRLRYGEDVDLWEHVNRTLPGRTILTHENRHYVFGEDITFVHLDDWDIQQLYGKEPSEVVAALRERGIQHYLRVPNEANHHITARLGMERVIIEGHAREIFRAGDNVVYELTE